VAVNQAFIGVGAVFGGYELLSNAEGFGLPEEWLAGTPFPDYRIPGLFLLIVLGIGMLAATVVTLLRVCWWPVLAITMGAILAAWLLIETILIGWRGDQQAILLVVCGIPALVMIIAGTAAGGVSMLRTRLAS